MKLPVSWINDFTSCKDDLLTLSNAITMNGLEVEDIYTIKKEEFASLEGEAINDEICWDVKVTPNRGDWLSILGVAREAAIVNKTPIKMPDVSDIKMGDSSVKINILTDKCKRYLGVVIKGVKLGDSPGWLKNRLIACGMRPINNIVDITNYVMLELGQPLHAFDLRLLPNKEINVRLASDGEKITTLDEIERELDNQMMVIADESKPVALAGIMGGANTEISDDTTDIFLETAVFDCYNVRRTSKRLNLSTESSYRFERTVDVELAEFVAKYATSLILRLAGGTIDGGLCDVYPNPVEKLVIKSDPNRINTLLGMDIPTETMVECLNTGHLPTKFDGTSLISEIPSYRTDLVKAIDMVEEVGRVYGYDKIGTTLPMSNLAGKLSETDQFHLKLRQIILSCGAQEIFTHSMVSSKQNVFSKNPEKQVIIRNPLSSDLDAMRQLLVPNSLEVLAGNQSHQITDMNLFEIANVYFINNEGIIDEKLHVAGALCGNLWDNAWGINCSSCKIDFFTVKGIVENLLTNIGVKNPEYKRCERKFLHPTQSAEIFVDGNHVGVFGGASSEILEYTNVRGNAFVYELDFNTLMSLVNKEFKYTAVDKFPAIRRHISVVVDKGVVYSEFLNIALENASEVVKDVKLIDVFESEKIGLDNKSLTIEILMRANRTLTDEEANNASSLIKDALVAKYN